MSFYVYREDLDAYLRRYGPLDHVRRDRSPSHSRSALRAVLAPSVDLGWPEVSILAASLEALAHRVAALEGDGPALAKRDEVESGARSALDWERRRRLELEDALAALEEDDTLVTEADELAQQAYEKLREAHRHLRRAVAQTRQPRTAGDLPSPPSAG